MGNKKSTAKSADVTEPVKRRQHGRKQTGGGGGGHYKDRPLSDPGVLAGDMDFTSRMSSSNMDQFYLKPKASDREKISGRGITVSI